MAEAIRAAAPTGEGAGSAAISRSRPDCPTVVAPAAAGGEREPRTPLPPRSARAAAPRSPRLAGERREHPDLGQRRDHRRPAVGEERQRETLRRETAEDDPRVHDAL